MARAILIYCLAYILEQKEFDDFNTKLLAVRCQWRYEVSRCGLWGCKND